MWLYDSDGYLLDQCAIIDFWEGVENAKLWFKEKDYSIGEIVIDCTNDRFDVVEQFIMKGSN